MQATSTEEELNTAADRVRRTAHEIREMATGVLTRSSENDADSGKAQKTADALAVLSDSLETVAEGARTSGLAVRDSGRDAARAVARAERVLRDAGFVGASAALAVRARRHATGLALAGAGMLALALIVRRTRSDD